MRVKKSKSYKLLLSEFKKEKINRDSKTNNFLEKLISNSKKYFSQQGVLINWREISKLKAFEQIYTLAMISPFSVSEKQKVLEVPDLNEVANNFNLTSGYVDNTRGELDDRGLDTRWLAMNFTKKSKNTI